MRLEINLIKKTDKELRFEVKGESSTLLNLLQKNLLEDEDVENGRVIHLDLT